MQRLPPASEVLSFYASPGRFTTLADGDAVPGGIEEIVAVVQGLLVYDVVAQPFYGVELASTQDGICERDSAALLDLVRAVDRRPIVQERPPEARVAARCHTYSRLTVAFLRSVGVPARVRCGFSTYSVPGMLEDHWVAECWDGELGRWRTVDANLDATWATRIGFAGDPLDVTGEEFVTAGHAWQAWRRGELDAGSCGLTAVGGAAAIDGFAAVDEQGAHWIANNLRLDLAALNRVEMLPWDVWGAGWGPGEEPGGDLLDLFDDVAALTTDPDERLPELRRRYESDVRLRMDGSVSRVVKDGMFFHVLTGESETVS